MKAARAQAGQPQGVAPTVFIPSPLGGEGWGEGAGANRLKLERGLDIAKVGTVVGIDLIHDAVAEDVGKKDVDVDMCVQIIAEAGFDNLKQVAFAKDRATHKAEAGPGGLPGWRPRPDTTGHSSR